MPCDFFTYFCPPPPTPPMYYNDVTLKHLIQPASRLFVQQFVQSYNKKDIKAWHYWSSVRGIHRLSVSWWYHRVELSNTHNINLRKIITLHATPLQHGQFAAKYSKSITHGLSLRLTFGNVGCFVSPKYAVCFIFSHCIAAVCAITILHAYGYIHIYI